MSARTHNYEILLTILSKVLPLMRRRYDYVHQYWQWCKFTRDSIQSPATYELQMELTMFASTENDVILLRIRSKALPPMSHK